MGGKGRVEDGQCAGNWAQVWVGPWECVARMNVIILYVVAEKVRNQTSFRLLRDGLLEDSLTECFGNQLGKLDTLSLSSAKQLTNILPFLPMTPSNFFALAWPSEFSKWDHRPRVREGWLQALGGCQGQMWGLGTGAISPPESHLFHSIICNIQNLPITRQQIVYGSSHSHCTNTVHLLAARAGGDASFLSWLLVLAGMQTSSGHFARRK